jgi:hypothetical protein
MKLRLPDPKQPTTQRGLVAMFTLLASMAPTEYRTQIVDVGLFVYACLLLWTNEDVNSRRT